MFDQTFKFCQRHSLNYETQLKKKKLANNVNGKPFHITLLIEDS